jgi:hypothetical protein
MDAHQVDALFFFDFAIYVVSIDAYYAAKKKEAEG